MPVLSSYRNQTTDLLNKSIDWFLYRATPAFNGLNWKLLKAVNYYQKSFITDGWQSPKDTNVSMLALNLSKPMWS